MVPVWSGNTGLIIPLIFMLLRHHTLIRTIPIPTIIITNHNILIADKEQSISKPRTKQRLIVQYPNNVPPATLR